MEGVYFVFSSEKWLYPPTLCYLFSVIFSFIPKVCRQSQGHLGQKGFFHHTFLLLPFVEVLFFFCSWPDVCSTGVLFLLSGIHFSFSRGGTKTNHSADNKAKAMCFLFSLPSFK